MGFIRRTFMVPMPRFPSFEAFNADPNQHCFERLGARLRRHGETIGERLRDKAAFLPLPPTTTTPATSVGDG